MASPALSRTPRESATAPTNSTSSAHPNSVSGYPSTNGTAPRMRVRLPASGRSARRQVRAQWLVLAAALTVLAGVLVAWSLDRAADRVAVVSIARPVAAGSVIEAADLTTTDIAFDTPITGLAPAASLDALVGRVATIDLEPGVLLSTGMWADGTELAADERTVGAVLDAGTHPSGIAPGSTALAVSLRAGTEGTDETETTAADPAVAAPAIDDHGVVVRVLDADRDERGALHVTLAVPAADAARLARLAAAGQLVLVGVPAVAAADTASTEPTSTEPTSTEPGQIGGTP